MHKLKLAIIIPLVVVLAGVIISGGLPVHATIGGSGNACDYTDFDDPLLCGTPNQNEEAVVQQKVANVLNQVYLWVGIIAVVTIVISGIRYMTSQGNPESVKKAKAGVMYASIGLVVVLSAFIITLAITNAIQGNQIIASDGGSGGDEGGDGAGGGGTSVVEISYIKISPASIRVEVGGTVKLTVGVVPDYATNRAITYTSSDTNVATVSSAGIVTGKKDGSVTITAESNNGKVAKATVNVFKIVEANSVSVAPATIELKKGKVHKFAAIVKPDDTKDKSVTWSSSDSSVATVGADGTVTAKKVGTATITAKTKNNKTGSATVTVVEDSSSGGGSSNPGGNNTADRHTIGSKALAVMHAANDGDINKVIKAGEKKYYAVECDVYISGGTIYCAHDGDYFGSNTPTLDRTMQEAKKYGMVVIIDHVEGSSETVAKYIKNNNLSSQVIVQLYNDGATSMINTMKSMNDIVGKKLSFMGCHMLSMSLNGYADRASEIKAQGMTVVNVQSGYDSDMRTLKNAGYELSVFTWVSFSQDDITKYNSDPYNVKYMMTNNVDVN